MLKCKKMFLFISLPIYSIATSIICYFLSSSLLLFVQGQRRSCKYWTWGGGGGGGGRGGAGSNRDLFVL